MFKNPLGLLLIVIFFVMESVLINPEIYELYAMTWHGFFLGLLAFLFGFSFILSGNTFWPTILKWRWLFLVLAIISYSFRFIHFELKSPHYLIAVESCMWIFTIFGFAYKYLNRPSKVLSYLSEGAYPIYIIHMILLYLGSFLILPLGIPTELKFILLVAFTSLGCFALYEFVIRRVYFLRPLFGLKRIKKTKSFKKRLLYLQSSLKM
jgi:peptidoglycan/LPS O-acetylase OafA/YrhL